MSSTQNIHRTHLHCKYDVLLLNKNNKLMFDFSRLIGVKQIIIIFVCFVNELEIY